MNWCFALINEKLAELFFQKWGRGRRFLGHAYVNKSEYKTKKELVWIEKETKLYQFKWTKTGGYTMINLPR